MAEEKKEKPLSNRQKSILQFIEKYIGNNGRPPAIREIVDATDITSTSVANYNLNKLRERGFIERDKDVSRGLRLTQKGRFFVGNVDVPAAKKSIAQLVEEKVAAFLRIPLSGTIAAGPLTESFEDSDEFVEVLPSKISGFRSSDDFFALRVSGESMIEDGIHDGDIAILRKQETARSGDTVAAWILGEDTATLKKFFREGTNIRLQPANSSMEPIIVSSNRVTIQGRLVHLERAYG